MDSDKLADSGSSQIRQNYNSETEKAINDQINRELYASYVYMSMAFHFDRENIALPGLHKFFKEMSYEEREHAYIFMAFQNQRGGKIILQDIKSPEKDDWGRPKDAMQHALELEKKTNTHLLDLHNMASSYKDVQLCEFLERIFLPEQLRSIKEFASYISQLELVGNGLGEYIFDQKFKSADETNTNYYGE